MNRTLIAAVLLAVAACAKGAPMTIVSAAGAADGQDVGNWIGETWTQTGTYTDVTISAALNGGVALPSTANVYLLNALGPGTTAGSNQIDYELATMPAATRGVTLFTGLTLSPGTYFLLADEVSAGWTGSGTPVYATDAGVTNISSFANNGAIASYAPDTPYELTSGDFFFNVSGVPEHATATPEPGTFALLLPTLACLLFAAKRHLRSKSVSS